MEDLIKFMESTNGRIARIVLGVILIIIALVVMEAGTAALIVAIIGLVPIVMGIWGPCLLGFVFKKK